ncbi:hypothetical protein N752_10690 [Desulforamulus aquiferis]|nr:hypothetical protein N752_10690 [Desulforamulus aquiferis]
MNGYREPFQLQSMRLILEVREQQLSTPRQ